MINSIFWSFSSCVQIDPLWATEKPIIKMCIEIVWILFWSRIGLIKGTDELDPLKITHC